AADTWHSTRAALTDYAERWKQAHYDACAATHIRHEQSEQTLDLRMRCLDRRLGRFAALSESLLHPTRDAIRTAPEAISTLGDIAACADADHLSVVVPPPDDPAQVAAIEAAIAAASARELAADLKGAFEDSFLAAEKAAQLGYPPLEAEAQLVLARVQDRRGEHDEATRAYTAAIAAAARGHDDRLVAAAWVDFAFHVGAYHPDATRLPDLRLAAETAIARAGDDLWLRARLGQAAATMLQRLGRPDEALNALQFALEVFDRDPEREPARRQQALNTAGLAYTRLGNYPAAQDAFQRALIAARRLYGPSHPAVAAILDNLANLALATGDIERADQHAREAAEIIDATLPPLHEARAASARIRAQIAEERGDLSRAQALYEEALAVYHAQPDVDSMHLGALYNDVAMLADRQGDLERARGHYREALKLFRVRFGPDHVYARTVERNLAELALWLDDPKTALDIADRLLATLPEEPPFEPPKPYILCLRAQAQLALGKLAAAEDSAEEAVSLLDARKGGIPDRVDAALIQLTLARVLAAKGTDPQRQLTLAVLAGPVLRDSDSTAAQRALPALEALSRPPARRGRSRAP
ncbi:MAG TPA: tetratricopeptide repeat protein, partial [Nannocystis sp.]